MASERSADYYREQYDHLGVHCVEAQGIPERAFADVLDNPLTVVLVAEEGSIPLVTPLAALGDRNMAYYASLFGTTESATPPPIMYYSHLPRLIAEQQSVIVDLLAPRIRWLANEGGMLVYDCAEDASTKTAEEVRGLLGSIGSVACHEVTDMPRHHDYLTCLPTLDRYSDHLYERLDFPRLYAQATATRAINITEPVEVLAALPEADFAHISSYYAQRHGELTETDATDAGFSTEALRHVLLDPNFQKIVYRVDGQVANLLIFAKPEACSWIDQGYLREAYPWHYDDGRMLVGIGAISDPHASKGLAMSTLEVAASLLAYAGGDAVMVYATDDASDAYIPHLCDAALRGAGFTEGFGQSAGGLAFHAMVLANA